MEPDDCRNCGATLEPDANFCSNCGAERRDDGIDGIDGTDGAAERAEPGIDYEPMGTVRSSRGARGVPDGDRTFAAVTHLLAIVTWVIGPLIVLVATDDEFVKENAREALNWQIAYTIYMIVGGVLVLVAVGLVVLAILPLINVALCAIAAVKANEGEVWEYPATPRFL
ncbi:hypothetical protein SAMN05444422_11395 [Halobiforma haloterrestris]|uniref:Zinc-ribbon domain-containing protein n=1 Tax=Natronobacterium haloterrestre TaxID=148448 RepID=A0A1I1KZB7_NATHA|nr:zinc ribbon domain-containing protein [Halobiforma haloterrestris]SFC66114.1 hypothetical protein SAMN05444422_11395 [Halobiforma haloterrestris]